MRRIVLLTLAMVMASTMGIAALAGPAGATTGSTHQLVIGALAPAAKKKTPNANINPGPVFNPTSVTGKKSSGKCTTKKFAFTISNVSGSTEEIDWTAAATGGAPEAFVTLKTGFYVGVCSKAKFSAFPVFQLASNTSSVLTVTIT